MKGEDIVEDTENQSVDSENQSVDSENQSVDSENQSVDSSNQSVDSSNQSVDSSNQSVDDISPKFGNRWNSKWGKYIKVSEIKTRVQSLTWKGDTPFKDHGENKYVKGSYLYPIFIILLIIFALYLVIYLWKQYKSDKMFLKMFPKM